MRPVNAATSSGTNVAACTAAQIATHRRYDPHLASSQGDASCISAPTTSGSVLTNPHASWLPVSASTKAGR